MKDGHCSTSWIESTAIEMIKGLIFDLGNTLMHFDGDWNEVIPSGTRALVEYLRADGIPMGETFGSDFVRNRRQGRELSARTDVEYTAARALRDTLAQYGYQDVSEAIIEHGIAAFFAPEEAHWVTYPDAVQTLTGLRASGYRIGLISNATDDRFIQRVTRRAGLAEFMDPITSSAAMPYRKPDPRIFQHVLDYWHLPASSVVMVGDWPSTDILGAHRAGMLAILLDERWPAPPHLDTPVDDDHLLEPDIIVYQLSQIQPIALERLGANPRSSQ